MLTEGTDYLYYARVYHSGGAITGLTNSEVAVVATRRFLFIIPERETSLGILSVKVKSHWFEGDQKVSVQQVVERVIAQSEDLEALETGLRELLPEGKHVTPLDELVSLSVWTRFFRQVRFRRAKRGATQVLALRGKANHERFKAFYTEELASRAARA